MLQIKNTLGGGKPEGMYVWKKCSTLDVFLEKYISTTEQKNNIFPYSPSNVLYKSSSYTFDKNTGIYTLVNPTSVSGSILQDAVHMYNGEYFMLNANSGATMYKAPTVASQESGVTASNSAYNGFSIQTYGNYGRAPYFIYSNESGTERTFITYVVSGDEFAYPDGGEKGGYWYERVVDGITPKMFGCTKMAVDTYTPSSNITKTIELSHSLGEKPKRIMILGDIGDNFSQGAASLVFTSMLTNGTYPISSYREYLSVALAYMNVSSNYPSKYAINKNDYAPYVSSASETSLTLKSSYSSSYPVFLLAGVKYNIITMA